MQKKNSINYVYLALQFVLIGLLIMFICTYLCNVQATEPFRESDKNIWQCVYCLLFSFLPFILSKWNIHSTKTLRVYFLTAIIVHFIGGETLHFYRDLWWFSWVVHLINSFLIATIIYGMLLRHCKHQSKFFMFLATVAFTSLVGVIWEVCEFGIDTTTGSNMQRFNNSITGEAFVGQRAILDTMVDIMMDTLGGIVAGLYFAYASIKGKPLYKFFELKYINADNNISYHEDHHDEHEQLAKAKAEKKALKIEKKNIDHKNKIERSKYKALHKKEKSQIKHEKKLAQSQQKLANKIKQNEQTDQLNTLPEEK